MIILNGLPSRLVLTITENYESEVFRVEICLLGTIFETVRLDRRRPIIGRMSYMGYSKISFGSYHLLYLLW